MNEFSIDIQFKNGIFQYSNPWCYYRYTRQFFIGQLHNITICYN